VLLIDSLGAKYFWFGGKNKDLPRNLLVEQTILSNWNQSLKPIKDIRQRGTTSLVLFVMLMTRDQSEPLFCLKKPSIIRWLLFYSGYHLDKEPRAMQLYKLKPSESGPSINLPDKNFGLLILMTRPFKEDQRI